MQFAQAERGPTPLPACKFTLMKIHNSFFCGQTTKYELNKNVRRFSKMATFQKSQFGSSKKYQPNRRFFLHFL